MIPVDPGGSLARRRRGHRGQLLGQPGVVTGHAYGFGQERSRLFGSALGQSPVGAAGERGYLGVRGRDPLAQRFSGGQPSGQRLRAAQPARGQLVVHLPAQGLERVLGEHRGRYETGLLFLQAELVRLRGDGPLDETAVRERPQPFDDL